MLKIWRIANQPLCEYVMHPQVAWFILQQAHRLEGWIRFCFTLLSAFDLRIFKSCFLLCPFCEMQVLSGRKYCLSVVRVCQLVNKICPSREHLLSCCKIWGWILGFLTTGFDWTTTPLTGGCDLAAGWELISKLGFGGWLIQWLQCSDERASQSFYRVFWVILT